MKPNASAAWEHVQLAAKLADLKEEHYRTLLSMSAMLELLIDKGVLTRDEVEAKTASLDAELERLISGSLHPMG